MSIKFVLAEKPSVAQSISAVLGANKLEKGYSTGNGYIVSWCYGHLVELAAPDAYDKKYKRWSLDTLPILPDKWQYTAYDDKKQQLAVLKELMSRADVESVVCATDAGREGELIFRLVYDYCKCKKPVQRLWISSLEDSAICNGFANLRDGKEYGDLYRAALCRAQADWLVGLNATRLFSCLYNGTTLNVGRVQSPTLAMIVERENAINTFVPTPFYVPQIVVNGDAVDVAAGFATSGERQSDLSAAEAIRAAADGHEATVISVEKSKKTAAPPKLFDLTLLQREANRLFGYTAQQTLDYLQSLYERKLTTYPRVDSNYLTEDMGGTAAAVIEMVYKIFPFGGASRDVDGASSGNGGVLPFAPDIARVTDNGKVSDHHAIIPTIECAKVDLAALPTGERFVLTLVAARLLCAVAPVHVYEATTAVLECGGHKFTARGKTVLADGWKAIDAAFRASLKVSVENSGDDGGNGGGGSDGSGGGDDGDSDGDDNDTAALPELTEGQAFPSAAASIREGKTLPPLRFTEGSLLRAMETASADDFPEDLSFVGLGTPATRAGVIEKLVKSGFIERQKKSLVPTSKGVNLVALLPDDIKSPHLTADWEQKLKLVENGELSDADFMAGITTLVKGLVAANPAPLPEVVARFEATAKAANEANLAAMGASGASSASSDKPCVGKCPRCGSGVTEAAKGFFCSNRDCKFVLWKDSRFWAAKGKTFTAKIAAALLSEGRVSFADFKSERTGKTYAATVVLADDGAKTEFALEFDAKFKGGGKR